MTRRPISSKRRLGMALTLAGYLAAMPLHVSAQRAPKISQAQIDAMFANMRAHAPWYVDGPLLWGFFFVDADKARLEAVAADLSVRGYRRVDIVPTQSGAEYRLHVERVEALTPTTLYARDVDFEILARRYQVKGYDGMDVGPVPVPVAAGGAGAVPVN